MQIAACLMNNPASGITSARKKNSKLDSASFHCWELNFTTCSFKNSILKLSFSGHSLIWLKTQFLLKCPQRAPGAAKEQSVLSYLPKLILNFKIWLFLFWAGWNNSWKLAWSQGSKCYEIGQHSGPIKYHKKPRHVVCARNFPSAQEIKIFVLVGYQF